MADAFARYVIGANSSSTSSDWLAMVGVLQESVDRAKDALAAKWPLQTLEE
jgi:hypothetical protein